MENKGGPETGWWGDWLRTGRCRMALSRGLAWARLHNIELSHTCVTSRPQLQAGSVQTCLA